MIAASQPPHHFGIDGRILRAPAGGNSVKHVLEQILLHLCPEKWNARFTCFTRAVPYPLTESLKQAKVDWNEPVGHNFTWRHLALPRAALRRKIEVMWFPFHTIPLRIGTPSVVTIHDVSFVALPHLFDRWAKFYLGTMLKRALAQASHIITISQFTADELIRRFNIPAKRISVIHHGLSENLTMPDQASIEALHSRLHLDRPYFLFLDGGNSRKNLGLLLRLLEKPRGDWLSEVQFVITGAPAPIEAILNASLLPAKIRQQIVLAGILPIGDLDILYRHTRGLLYLSEYEGFGLPILEAFARHCPVVALRGSSLPEVAGEGAIYIEPQNVSQLEQATASLLQDNTRKQLIALGESEGHRFNWGRAADQVAQTLLQTAGAKSKTDSL